MRVSGVALVVPVHLDGAVVAVLVVARTELGDLPLDECGRRLEHLVFPIAVSVDRVRMEKALDQHVAQEIAALRHQLDAYAVDFRSTYLAERDRSQQLAGGAAPSSRRRTRRRCGAWLSPSRPRTSAPGATSNGCAATA